MSGDPDQVLETDMGPMRCICEAQSFTVQWHCILPLLGFYCFFALACFLISYFSISEGLVVLALISSFRSFGLAKMKGDEYIHDRAVNDLDHDGDVNGGSEKYDPRGDERDMARLGKRQDLKVSTLQFSVIETFSWIGLTSNSDASVSSPSLAT